MAENNPENNETNVKVLIRNLIATTDRTKFSDEESKLINKIISAKTYDVKISVGDVKKIAAMKKRAELTGTEKNKISRLINKVLRIDAIKKVDDKGVVF